MRCKFPNHARNVWDRAVALLPRVDQFWYKYSYMEVRSFTECLPAVPSRPPSSFLFFFPFFFIPRLFCFFRNKSQQQGRNTCQGYVASIPESLCLFPCHAEKNGIIPTKNYN